LRGQNFESRKTAPEKFEGQLFRPARRDKIPSRQEMPREFELRLPQLLSERKMRQADLAKRLGLSKGTVAAYYGNSWTVLDRTTLEQMADILGCDAGELLASQETPFFDAFGQGIPPTCVYLRRPDAARIEAGRPVGQRDYRAMDYVLKLLEDCVKGLVSVQDSVSTPQEFDDRLRHNCVVLGSPWVNKAAEIALCRIFGVEAFQPACIHLLPFHFRVIRQETLPASSLIQAAPDEKSGVWLRDEKEFLPSHAWPRDRFYDMDIKKGQDCGIVVVSNYQGDDGAAARKLIVLSGFRGIGTEAAAMALSEYYRDLEPRNGKSYVWGAIEVLYNKPAKSIHRDLVNYKWRYRQGGRCPVAFSFRKPSA
jgi:transcriptional regulator with XRE-family HTH domain